MTALAARRSVSSREFSGQRGPRRRISRDLANDDGIERVGHRSRRHQGSARLDDVKQIWVLSLVPATRLIARSIGASIASAILAVV